MTGPIIEVSTLRKVYGDLVGVDGITFDVRRGDGIPS
jgi:ABC-type phosphonate transport system ATPase subunit